MIRISRRDLFRMLPLISLAPTVPGFIAKLARAAVPDRDGRILVVIQLDGGNDGLNCVVPFGDEAYAKNRRTLKLATDRLIKISDGIGLHPAMGEAGKLVESGRLAIVPGVGYPNPDRSHFREHGDLAHGSARCRRAWRPRLAGPGTRLNDRRCVDVRGPGIDPRGDPGPSLRPSASLERIEDLTLDPGVARSDVSGASGDLAGFVRRSTLDAYASSDRLAGLAKEGSSAARYPGTELANRLKLVARLIKGGYESRVFYTSQGGYDTHSQQLGVQFGLLGELSGALKAFLDDMAASNLADRILVLCFSEFGRRVLENGSGGTDHGAAGPVFLAGTSVKPGLLGAYPSLTELEDGDLKPVLDFRRVYATILEGWLGLPPAPALGGAFERLSLLKANLV